MSDTGNHCIKYYARNKEVKTLNLNVEFPIGTCLTSDSRLIIIDWKGAKMLRNGKISAPVSGSRVAKIYKGKISCHFYFLSFQYSELGQWRSNSQRKNSARDSDAVESRLQQVDGQDLRYWNGSS